MSAKLHPLHTPTEVSHVFLIESMRATWPDQFKTLDLIILLLVLYGCETLTLRGV
jgi:hypothetical protein